MLCIWAKALTQIKHVPSWVALRNLLISVSFVRLLGQFSCTCCIQRAHEMVANLFGYFSKFVFLKCPLNLFELPFCWGGGLLESPVLPLAYTGISYHYSSVFCFHCSAFVNMFLAYWSKSWWSPGARYSSYI